MKAGRVGESPSWPPPSAATRAREDQKREPVKCCGLSFLVLPITRVARRPPSPSTRCPRGYGGPPKLRGSAISEGGSRAPARLSLGLHGSNVGAGDRLRQALGALVATAVR